VPLLTVVLALAAPARGAPGSEPVAPTTAELRPTPEQARPDAVRPEEGEEVLVEDSQRAGPDPASTSASVTVVPVDGRLPATADVAQVLQGVSGTSVVHLGGLGDFSAVSIRGSSLRQVQIFLDGVPLNPDGSDVVNLSELPLQAFSRVEVWRGNAPPWYGAAPIGGVVDLVTATQPVGSSALSYGQHDTSRLFTMQAFRGSLAHRHLDGLAVADIFGTRGDFRYFDDNATIYTVTDDRVAGRDNDDKRQLSTLGRLRWGDEGLRLSVLDTFLARDEGLPGNANAPAQQARLDTLRNLAVAQAEGHAQAWRGTARLWLQQRQESFADPADEIGTGAGTTRGWFTTAGNHGDLRWAPRAWLMPSLSLDLRRDAYVQADLDGGRVQQPRIRWSGTGAVAADLRFLHDRITLSPVLQAQALDDHALGEVPVEGGPVGGDQQQAVMATPRLGLLLRPWSTLSLKANAGRTVRPPDLTELFGDRGAVQGNAELRPEKALSADVGARLSWPGPGQKPGPVQVAADLTAFWGRTTDLIVLVQNAQRTSIPVNFGLTWVQGVEGALTVQAGELLDSQTSFTWTLSRNLTPDPSVADNQLPRIPALELWQATGLHWGEKIRLGHTFSFTDGNYWDATNFYRSAPRPIHGAFLRIQPDAPGRGQAGRARWPSLELSILNLADRIVQIVPRNPLDPADPARIVQSITDYAGYPLPGRTWMLTLRWVP